MAVKISVEHKRGDTFKKTVTVTSGSAALDITGWSIKSDIRTAESTLVQSLTVTLTDAANGVYTLTATAAQTKEWPIGKCRWDIEYTDTSGTVISSETYDLKIVEDVTYT